MAICGVGIDLVQVDRIRQGLERWGKRFTHRLFTHREREDCAARASEVQCLALRFAAKEAFAKALGTGIRHPLYWRDIEVRSDKTGRPYIELSERACKFVKARGVRSWHLSLTDDGAYGAAVVILEGNPDSRSTSRV